jgi:uncharacterized membrane protein YccF (DUF307 family)
VRVPGPQPGDGVLSGRFIFAGWWLAPCLTIIGAALIPLGKEIVALPEGTYAGMIVFDAGRRLH